jgi:hypothetical protein
VDLFGSFALLFIAVTLLAAGLWNRAQPELHKRLMLAGTLTPSLPGSSGSGGPHSEHSGAAATEAQGAP